MPYPKPKRRARGRTNGTFAPVKIDLEDFEASVARTDAIRASVKKWLESLQKEVDAKAPKG